MFDNEGAVLQYPSIFSILPNKQYGTLELVPANLVLFIFMVPFRCFENLIPCHCRKMVYNMTRGGDRNVRVLSLKLMWMEETAAC